MSLLRTDQQVAIQALHLSMVKMVHHYIDAAEFLQTEESVKFMQTSAEQYEQFCMRIVDLLNKLGDLPMPPDVEKENLEQLMFHVEAKASADEVTTVFQQRLDAEEELSGQIKQTQGLQLEEDIQQVLEDIQRQVMLQIEQIRIKLPS